MKRITSSLLALLLALSMLIGMVPAAYAAPADTIESIDSTETVDSSETEDVSDESEDVAAYAADTELTDYVVVKGIKGFESRKFASFADAYAAIKPEIEKLASSDALGQGGATSAEAFKNFFTNVDENGNATLTYEITGNVVYDETNCEYLLTMGRHSSHYNNGEWLHLIKFKFVGTTANRGATLTVNSDITLPYEWWGEKVTTSISFENLTITGSAPSGLYPYQSYFEGIDFEVNNCTLNGIKIYNCSNVGGKYTITNSTLDGTGAPVDAYAIHLQGNESAPLTIKIDNNQISGYDRGINIDQKTAVAEITGNEISIKDKGRSCIQLTWLAKTTVSGNKLALTGGNAITLHEGLLGTGAVPEITVTGNTITGNGHLIYDDAAANKKAFTSENLNFTFDNTNTVDSTVDKKTGVKGGVEYDLSEIVDNKVNGSSTTGVAKVGETPCATLDAAFSALGSTNYTLTLLDGSAWDTATPVYWEAGTQSGYVAKLTDALTAAYMANAGDIKIVCRPGADVGTMTHGHVADNITIYGNNAHISGGECDLEVDTYKFSRETGAQDTTNGESLTKDITITAYELDNLGVWGQRTTDKTVTVNLTDCDGKAIEGKTNVQRVYISGTSGVNNITLTGCDFMTNNTSVYSNADGAISINNCSFTGSAVPVNFNHKANGTQTVTVSNSTFTKCGDDGEWKQFAAPVRFVNSGSGTQSATVDACTFAYTVGSNGDILLGDGRTGQKSNEVSLTVMNTDAEIQAQKPGYYNGEATDESKLGTKTAAANETVTTTVEQLVQKELTAYVTVNNGTEKYETLDAAIAAAEPVSRKITYTIYGKTEVSSTGSAWIQVLKDGLKNVTTVAFVGATADAEISLTNPTSVLADLNYDINVTFTELTLSHPNGQWIDDQAHATEYFATVLRNTNASGNTVTYTNCTFPDGACNNLYGKTVFDNCQFTNTTKGKYNLWNNGGKSTTVKNCTFTGARGIKTYNEGKLETPPTVKIENTTFNGLTDNKAAVVASKATDITFTNVTTENCTNGLIQKDIEGSTGNEKVTVIPDGTGVSGTFNVNAEKGVDPADDEFNLTAGTFKEEVSTDYLADGFSLESNEDGDYDVKRIPVATINGTPYNGTLAETIKAAAEGDTITLLKNVTLSSALTISKAFTLDLSGFTLDSTAYRTIQLNSGANLTVQDSVGNGKIANSYNGGSYPSTVYLNAKDTVFTLVSGTIESDPYKTSLQSVAINSLKDKACTVNIQGGSVVVPAAAKEGRAIVASTNSMTLNISDGKIAGGLHGIDAYSGSTVNITGGKVTATYVDTGVIKEAYGMRIIGTANVTINGGEIQGIKMDDDGYKLNVPNVTLVSGKVNGSFYSISTGTIVFTVEPTATITFEKDTVKNFLPSTVELVQNTDGTYGVKKGSYVAEINGKQYASLSDAIAAAKDGAEIRLLSDVTENGMDIEKSFTLDFNTHTLTVEDPMVGSTGTKTNAIRFLKNGDTTNTVVLKNGSIKSSKARILIQNYANLTVDNMVLDLSEQPLYGYVLSNNNGVTVINNSKISAPTAAGSLAFDACAFSTYGDVSVTLRGNSVINGDVGFSRDGNGTQNASLTLESGKINGNLVDVGKGETVTVTKSNDVTLDAPTGYKWVDGTLTKITYVAEVNGTTFETLVDAIAAAKDNDTVTLLADTTEDVVISKNITLDLNGFTLTNTEGEHTIVNNGTLTIKDSSTAQTGTVDNVTHGRGALVNNGTVILSGGTFERSAEKGKFEPYGNGGNSWYTIANYGTMTIDNGTTVKNAGGYSSNIRNGGQDSTAKLTINGGTFDGGVNTVKNDANGVLEIKGGELKNTAQYVIMNWNKATISGGIFETAETAGAVLFSSAYQNQSAFCGELTITGGTFTAAGSKLIDDAYDADNHGTVKISGGSFNRAVDPKHCDTGFIPKDNGDGTYGVKEGVYVAKVDNVKYETLQAAINAAKGGSTVRLLANVTLTETAVFPAGKTVHLNLVGHNITATGTALRINGTTDIQSTGGVGTIESTGNVAVAVGNNASLTVYSGTLKGREGAVITGTSTGAKIEIRTAKPTLIATDNAVIAGNGSKRDGNPNTILVKGGTFIGGIVSEGYIACGIYAPWNDSVTVSGGTFNITNGAGIVARAGNVKVTGGTFKCGDGQTTGWVGDSKNKVPNAALVFDKAANYPALTESSQILVSGGTFSTDPAANGAKLADGYVANKDESGMYKVAKSNPVAEINGVKYDTLQAAINAAQATQGGATITLLKNINTESYYTVNGDNPVTIDLAGCNITGSGISGLFYVTAKGDLTIKGEGIVTAVEDNGAAMAVWVRSPIAKVTLEGGTYTQQITNTNDPHFDLIYVERGNVYVKGGTYKGFTPDWTLNCKDEHYLSKEANIEVTGGTFYGFDPGANPEGEGTTYVKTGYVSTANTDGTYGVKKGTYVAAIGENKYATLAEAVDAAKNGDTITLIADVEQNTMLVIKKDITLDLAGKKIFNTTDIWSDANGSYELLSIEAKVTITGNGTIDAKENDCYTINVKNGDLTIENGTFYGNVSVVQVEAGTLTINGGKFDLHQKWEGKNTYLINCIDDAFVAKTAKVAIYGGDFVDFDPNVSPEKKIDGKAPSFAAPGVGITKNENNTFTAQAGMAAQIVDADGNSVKAYEELSAAVTAADNQTVKLLKNADIIARGLTIATGKTVTLDLNGYTIEAANTNVGNIKVYGKLTLMDSTDTKKDGTGTGKITTSTPYVYNKTDKVLIAAMDGGTFIMESGLIDAASFIVDNANNGQFAVSVQNENGDAAVIINGGHIKAGWYAVAGNGTCTKHNGDITVNGGILESTADYAIYHPHTGTTTINGGTIYGAAGGVSLNRGKLVVNGGTITSKGTGSTGDWGDGTGKQDAAAINVNAQYDSTSVEIKGGTITAENDAILLTNGKDGTIAVSGGQFSHEVKAEYCAIGYQPKTTQDPNTKLYTVEKVNGNAYYVDDSGKPVYGDLEKLLADSATNSKAIMLLDDVVTYGTDFLYLRANKTIDLNGKTLVLPGKLFGFGKIIDSTDGTGLLKIGDMDGSQLPSNNGYLPVLDKAVEGYRLYSYTMKLFKTGYNVVGNGNTVKFAVQIEFANLDAWNKIAADDNSVELVFEAKWNTNVSIFRFEDTQLDKIAKDVTEEKRIGYFILTINGFNNISGVEFRMTPQIKCKLFTQTIDTIIYK